MNRRPSTRPASRVRFPLAVESLEDRAVPAMFVVTTLVDEDDGTPDGSGGSGLSLREAIRLSNTSGEDDIITFAPGLKGEIVLSVGDILSPGIPATTPPAPLTIDNTGFGVTITGPGTFGTDGNLAPDIAISGGNQTQILRVEPGATATLEVLEFRNGANLGVGPSADSRGGAISNVGNLALDQVFINNSQANSGGSIENVGNLRMIDSLIEFSKATTGSGGAILNSGNLEAVRSYFEESDAFVNGGGIANVGSGRALLVNSAVVLNSAGDFGGGISEESSSGGLTLVNSNVLENKAGTGGGIFLATGPTSVRMLNTVVANNIVDFADTDISGLIESLGNNLIGDASGTSGTVPSDLVNVDPLLGDFVVNGGFFKTAAPLPGSPLLAAGNSDVLTGVTVDGVTVQVTEDIRGVPRRGPVNIGYFEAAAETLTLTGVPSSIIAGEGFTFTASLFDRFGLPSVGYVGTVSFASSDPAAVLPSNFAFSLADGGSANFEATLNTAGGQTITTADVSDPSLADTVTIAVEAVAGEGPVAIDDFFMVAPTAIGVTLDALANDAPAGALRIVAIGELDPEFGTAANFGDRILFTPSPVFEGTDSFTYTVSDAKGRTATADVFVTVEREANPATAPSTFLVLSGSGSSAVRLLDLPDLTPRPVFTGFPSPEVEIAKNRPFAFLFNPVRSAVGDFNGDGVEDLVLGSSFGGEAQVRVIDGRNLGGPSSGDTVFNPFPSSRNITGVFLAAGDFTGDGFDEIVIAADDGGSSRVRIVDRFGNTLADFFAIEGDRDFTGGVRVAVGDLNGDGIPDLVVAAGFGGGPRVAIFDGSRLIGFSATTDTAPPKLIGDFFVFEESLRNGAFVAVADVDEDGFADLAVAGGPGGAPRVRILSGKELLLAGTRPDFGSRDQNGTTLLPSGVVIADFFAANAANRSGARIVFKNGLDTGSVPALVVASDSSPVLANPTPADAQVGIFLGSTLRGLIQGPDDVVRAPDILLEPPFPGELLFDGVFVG